MAPGNAKDANLLLPLVIPLPATLLPTFMIWRQHPMELPSDLTILLKLQCPPDLKLLSTAG